MFENKPIKNKIKAACVSEEEAKIIEEFAKKSKCSVSAWIRMAIKKEIENG